MLSLQHLGMNCWSSWSKTCHLTLGLLLHYLVKFEIRLFRLTRIQVQLNVKISQGDVATHLRWGGTVHSSPFTECTCKGIII